jgi:hypothetical protein
VSGFSRYTGVLWWHWLLFSVLIIVLLAASGGQAQSPSAGGQVSTPESSIEQLGDAGVRAHTNIQIYLLNRGAAGGQAPAGVGSGGAHLRSPQPPGTEGASGGARPQ